MTLSLFEPIAPVQAAPPIEVKVLSSWAPLDTGEAHAEWGANCGPCSLAAVAEVPVAAVREAFPWFPGRPWTTAGQMVDACRSLGLDVWLAQMSRGTTFAGAPGHLGPRGLAQIQFTGPWTKPGENQRWAYQHTHFVAYRSLPLLLNENPAIYDVNLGKWCRAAEWTSKVAPEVARGYPRADGGWWIRSAVQLRSGGSR